MLSMAFGVEVCGRSRRSARACSEAREPLQCSRRSPDAGGVERLALLDPVRWCEAVPLLNQRCCALCMAQCRRQRPWCGDEVVVVCGYGGAECPRLFIVHLPSLPFQRCLGTSVKRSTGWLRSNEASDHAAPLLGNQAPCHDQWGSLRAQTTEGHMELLPSAPS